MECWVSKKGAWSLFLKEFWKILRDFKLNIFEKGQQKFKGRICVYMRNRLIPFSIWANNGKIALRLEG